jgi:hypothetical protein
MPPEQESAAPAFSVQQPAEPILETGSDTSTFDLDAAKLSARQLAGHTKLGREGLANAQLPDPPLETESKLATAKKDHGCKWQGR